MHKAKKEVVVASLVIHGAPRMHSVGKRRVAAWIAAQGKYLMKHNKELSSRFVAKYIVEGES